MLHNPASGEAARRLFEDAQAMLDRIVAEKWLRARGVFGLFPANRVDGDDIEVYTDETRTAVRTTLHQLRQQTEGRDGAPRKSLADFVAPKETGLRDYVGAFAVTAGSGLVRARRRVQEGERRLLGDPAGGAGRPARRGVRRAAARAGPQGVLGLRARRAPRQRGADQREVRGIRPAPGYPACPEHTEKQTIWNLLDVEANAGIELTESMAMWPGAAVSGLYFSHPQSRYFVLGRLGRDQVEDYARRKGWTVAEAERWLSPNLGYRTEDE